jgi:formiminotetrahydrofolate cyclodeaminase
VQLLPVLLERGNPNLVSDVGVAADLCLAAFRCAWLNVEINFASIKDEEYKAENRALLEEKRAAVEKTAREVWAETVKRVTGG